MQIEVLIHRMLVKHVLIDGGDRLNICSMNLVRALGYSKDAVDPQKKTKIKAHNEEENSSKGMVILPITVGPL